MSDGAAVNVVDVFGLEDSESPDCVICLSDGEPGRSGWALLTRAAKAVTLLPCRHLCLCTSCFSQVDRCPVCRAAFAAYLVQPSADAPTVSAA